MANDINLKVGMDGEKELKKGIADINRQLKTLDLELKKATAEFESNADSQEALDAKSDILNRTLQAQSKKVEETQKVLAKMSEQYGENSREAQDWNDKLLRAQRDLAKTENAIKGMNDELDDTEKESKDASSGLSKLSSVGKGVSTALKGIGAAVAAAGAAIGGAISGINNLAESTRELRTQYAQLDTVFQQNGKTVEQGQKVYDDLFAVVGDSARANEASANIAKIAKSQQDLNDWTTILTGTFAQYNDGLPIESLAEAANETAKTATVTGTLADAINWANISASQWSAALAGNKSAQTAFNDAIKSGSTAEDAFNAALAACSSEQERAKLITSSLKNVYQDSAVAFLETAGATVLANEAQNRLNKATAALGEDAEYVSATFKNIGAEILENLVPAFDKVSEGLRGMLSGDENAADALGEGIGEMFNGIVKVINEYLPVLLNAFTTVIPELLNSLTESLPVFLDAGVGIITSLIEGVAQAAPSLIESGIEVLGSLISGIFEAIPSLIEAIPEIILSFVNGLTENLPTVIQAGISLLQSLAEGITQNLPEFIDQALTAIDSFADMLTENLPLLIDAGIEMLVALAQGIADALPTLIERVPEIISKFADLINDNMPTIILAGIQILVTLVQGIIEAIPTLIKELPKVITAIFKVFEAVNWMKIGKTLITSIGNGIKNMGSSLKSSADDVIKKLRKPIDDVVLKAKTWGKDLIDNIVKGIKSMIGKVTSAVKDVAGKISSFLHFSVPDEGPLVDAPKWMPDMIDLMTKGIRQNESKVEDAARSLAEKMRNSLVMSANLTNVGSGRTSYTFSAPVYLDGKKIADNTQRYITSEQRGLQRARGHA